MPCLEPSRKHHWRDSIEDEHKETKKAVTEFMDGIVKEQQQKQKENGRGGGGESGMNEDELEMMKMLGIPIGFDSTKGKPMLGADEAPLMTEDMHEECLQTIEAFSDSFIRWLVGLLGWQTKELQQCNGTSADQVAGWLTGLANQGTTTMVLMQIRSGGWLAYWISKPRNYTNGANADQGAGWLTGLANQGITTMVLMQIRGLSQFDEEQVCAVTVQEFWETLVYLYSYFDSFPSSDPYPILVLPFDQVLINLRDIDLEKSGVMFC
ncbi:hypothetical protein VNO77_34855 [Canavalia gladiata]|uniref:Uncharacterized protein n=1 Tax=Canavalia gladiata TaxID=3824 RepID=A0AAN9KES0_CANGL